MITAEQVKTHRKALKLSQKAFAAYCGVSEQQVRLHWEKTGIPNKSLAKAEALVKLRKDINK
jgi:DNA-binding transcriptional regulator YiaG